MSATKRILAWCMPGYAEIKKVLLAPWQYCGKGWARDLSLHRWVRDRLGRHYSCARRRDPFGCCVFQFSTLWVAGWAEANLQNGRCEQSFAKRNGGRASLELLLSHIRSGKKVNPHRFASHASAGKKLQHAQCTECTETMRVHQSPSES